MDGPKATTSPTGMRRVDFVRIMVEGDAVLAQLVGVGHRLPACRPVPLAVAARLAREGTPVVTRHLGTERRDQRTGVGG